MGFGGAEDEDHPLGRLLQCLQQGVESFVRDLVRFIDDEDLVAVARRTIADVFAHLAHFVDAAVRSRVDLDDVDRFPALISTHAGADSAGRGGRALHAIQAAGQNARDGGLAGTALAGKDIAVRDAPL